MSESGFGFRVLLPLALACGLFVVFLPLPTFVMDCLLVSNLAIAVLILVTSVLVRRPIEFNIFP
ncbi:MAG TPA: FHIPEP family type III secretion protein, partial [Pirellulaceae bacterium]